MENQELPENLRLCLKRLRPVFARKPLSRLGLKTACFITESFVYHYELCDFAAPDTPDQLRIPRHL